jgi:hypothetical protein
MEAVQQPGKAEKKFAKEWVGTRERVETYLKSFACSKSEAWPFRRKARAERGEPITA